MERTPDRDVHGAGSAYYPTSDRRFVRGEGIYLYDADGRRYIDCASATFNLSLGYSHPAVITAMREQADQFVHLTSGFASEPVNDLARNLVDQDGPVRGGDASYRSRSEYTQLDGLTISLEVLVFRSIPRGVKVAVAALAMLAGLLVVQPAANAAGAGRVCEAFGHGFCLGSANFSLFTPVTEKPVGRNFNVVTTGTTFQGFTVVKIQFSGATTKCVAANNERTAVVIHACNKGGVDWALDTSLGNGHVLLMNTRATEVARTPIFLTGRSKSGSQYVLRPRPSGVPDGIQQFN